MRHPLNTGWSLQSSAGGPTYSVDVPTTVLGALVDLGVYPDPFTAKNFLEIPGQGPIADNFSNHEMPEGSPFAVSWWFRKDFEVPAALGPHVALQLDGINYRANIWLNGKKIAGCDEIVGAYVEHELDLTEGLRRGQTNRLEIEVFPSKPNDVAISWVDWNPSPPDKSLGIWRDVWLQTSGAVGIRAPHVSTKLEGTERAHLTVGTDLVNHTPQSQYLTLRTETLGRTLSSEITLSPGETRRVEQTLTVDQPELWWPRSLGTPTLHTAQLTVEIDGISSDRTAFDYGIREVHSALTPEGASAFFVNGTRLLIRGAGWATDLFLRRQPERDFAQLAYVKAMNLNTIRFEGMLERAEFLEWCDQQGILVIAGWCCCDCWEKWTTWCDETHDVARASLRSQVRRVRRHPSLITWWYGSDFPPPPHVEQAYLDVFAAEHWPNPTHSSAADKPTELTGSSGMKMAGPYDYVPPSYWLDDSERGGAFGFATEVCPGPAVPPIESLKQMLGPDHLWPIDEVWNYHSGGAEFHNITLFTQALEARYGPVSDVETFARLSQLAAYEGQRAMFEAYAKKRHVATGVIQWMLNNAWPSLIWHLFDYYLRPGGGFFGTLKACEPLHIMYATDDHAVTVINDTGTPARQLSVSARVFDLSLQELAHETALVDAAPSSALEALVLPEFSTSRIVDLRLSDPQGRLLSQNLYWCAATDDVLDHAEGNWYTTPVTTFADLSAFRSLPPATVELEAGQGLIAVRNPTDALAFFVQLQLIDAEDSDIRPILWSDNYVSLLPGERRVLTVQRPNGEPLPPGLRVRASGLNIPGTDAAFPRNTDLVAK